MIKVTFGKIIIMEVRNIFIIICAICAFLLQVNAKKEQSDVIKIGEVGAVCSFINKIIIFFVCLK